MFSWIIFTKRVCLLGGEQNFQNLFLTSSTTLKMVTKKTPKTCLNMWILIEVVITWFKRPCSNSIQQNANISFFQMHRTLWDSTQKISLLAASATGGWQALHHSWTCCTPVWGTYLKHFAAGLLTVKWIELLLVICWGFHPPQGVINLESAF